LGSIFSIFNRREANPSRPAGALPPPEPTPLLPEETASAAAAAAAAGETAAVSAAASRMSPILAVEEVPGRLVELLSAYLPPVTSGSIPAHNVILSSFNPLPLALGNLRGIEPRGPFASVELRGGRLDAVARFQVWADDAGQANTALAGLQGRLLAARKDLWADRVLRLALQETTPALLDSTSGAWNALASYRVLFEYTLADLDGAQSLITRIPVNVDPEERGSLMRELLAVTGAVVRWDNETAQVLALRGPLRLRGLSILDFLPGGLPTTGVTLLRSYSGASGPPSDAADLAGFLSAAAAQPAHVRLRLASMSDFLNLFADTGKTMTMGNWDEPAGDPNPDEYRVRLNTFPSPLHLPFNRDTFQIAISGASLDRTGIIYLSADRI
jgi:hypothetical protein